ncbi:MAG: DNA topoisomerase 3, partial [Oligoflexia bacterium]|nr:DNA topoisomerase 3 [Oligoflexia bacterium]
LVTLPQPQEINPLWKVWKKSTLPMLPVKWTLRVIDKTKDQFTILAKLMNSAKGIVCATDAGREGELIFRYIYEASDCDRPVKRLWISSLTPDAIKEGFKQLKLAEEYNQLADAARARSYADWLIGMNFSRAYALMYQENFFVGRVQTPTLAMVVKRDLEIRSFKVEKYFEINAKFATRGGGVGATEDIYEATYVGEESEYQKNPRLDSARLESEKHAKEIITRLGIGGEARVRSLESKSSKQLPPLLYDLTELQRQANRVYGFSAAQTLELAQSLYEKHKLISYPRTDSRYLSESVAATLPKIVAIIKNPYAHLLAEKTGVVPLGKRFVNDAEVSDHHAIIPTTVSAGNAISPSEKNIYDLICRRLLSAWQSDYITATTTILTDVRSKSNIDIFKTQGTVVEQLGWKLLEAKEVSKKEKEKDKSKDRENTKENKKEKLLPLLNKGEQVQLKEVKAQKKSTTPPPHLTEAALLTAMESAGKNLEDKELASAIKDSGLGTPATRANIIETLIERKYIERSKKSLLATEMGIRLIEIVHPTIKSPELTARWERELTQIKNGTCTLSAFMKSLEEELNKRVQEILLTPPIPPAMRIGVGGDDAKSEQQQKEEDGVITHILERLKTNGSCSAGKLYQAVLQMQMQTQPLPQQNLDRKKFEAILRILFYQKKIRISEERFVKNGEVIEYRKIFLSERKLNE